MGAAPSVESPPDAPLPAFGASDKEKAYEAALAGKQDAVRKLFYSLDVGKDAVLTLDRMNELVTNAKVGKADAEHLKAWFETLEDKPGHGGLGEREFGYYLAETAIASSPADLGVECADEAPAKLDAVLGKCQALSAPGPKIGGLLHSHEVSQPSRSCSWFAEWAGLATESRMTDLFGKAEQKAPEYVAKFPSGQVPAYEDGDFCVEESQAIIRYLASGNDIVPACPKAAAKVDMLLAQHGSKARLATSDVFRPILFKSDDPAFEDILKKGIENIQPMLGFYNGVLEKNKFLAGDTISLADFMFVPEVDQFVIFAPKIGDLLEKYPHIKSYLERMKEVKGYTANFEKMTAFMAAMMKAKEEKAAAAAAEAKPAE